MADVALGVRGQCQSEVLIFGLTRKPLLLFRHASGIRAEKGERVPGKPQLEIITFFRLCLVDDLLRLVEPLPGNRVGGEIRVPTMKVRGKKLGLPGGLGGFLILPELSV